MSCNPLKGCGDTQEEAEKHEDLGEAGKGASYPLQFA